MSAFYQRVLVLGSSGLLGSYLLSGSYLKDYVFFGQGRDIGADIQIELEDPISVQRMIEKVGPTTIINLVGLTDVDRCEQFPQEAYKVNVRTLENIVRAIQILPYKPRIIHISTDQVYDGLGPHKEDNISLSNYYAFSKYSAELVAMAAEAMVLRTNFFGKSRTQKRKSLTDWLAQEVSAGHKIKVFEDVFFSPLSMHTLCEVIKIAVDSTVKGVFNLGASDGMSKADFAYEFAKCVGLSKEKMSRVNMDDVDFIKTYRPKDMRMDISAIEKAMGIRLPTIAEEIKIASQEYK